MSCEVRNASVVGLFPGCMAAELRQVKVAMLALYQPGKSVTTDVCQLLAKYQPDKSDTTGVCQQQ